jgi:integrase
LLLVGFMGALRRSEIVGLDVGSLGEGATGTVEIATDGLLIHLARSKTDQEGAGQKIAIPRRRDGLCAAAALEAWLSTAGISSGPVFRFVTQVGDISASRLTAQSVRLIVKKRIGDFDTAHGLRSGFITEGARRGAGDRELMKTSRHRSTDQIGVYIRDANIWDGTAHRRMED